MPKASRLDWRVLLSHSRAEELDRCIAVPVGRGVIHLCARCLGLYPALALALWARLLGGELPPKADWLLRLAVPLTGAAGWVLEQSGRDLPKPIRLLSGAMLGLGLGWVLALHARAPWPRELLELAAGLALAGLLGLALRVTRLPEADDLPPLDLASLKEDQEKTKTRRSNIE